MSAITTDPIAEANDRVRLSALNKLARRLDEETDPIRLEKLLSIALRTTSAPRRTQADPQLSKPATTSTPTASREATPPRDAAHAASTPIPTRTRTNAPSAASTDDLSYDDLPQGPADPLPTFHPMTDDEFVKLAKEIGLTEAHRQRIIRADLVNTQRERAANSS